MNESDFNAEYVRRWRERSPGAWVHKLADIPVGMGTEKPFDIIGIDNGVVLAIESKLHRKHTAWPISTLAPHQLRELRLAEASGAVARVIVAVRVLLDVTTQRRLGFRKRRFSFDLWYTTAQILDLQRRGVKSVEILPFLRERDAKPDSADDKS